MNPSPDPNSANDQHSEREDDHPPAETPNHTKPDTERDQVAETVGLPESAKPAADLTVDNYEIIKQIGRGGMGVVYQARQLSLNRVVALKMIIGGAHADELTRKRFLREAESAASLQHPNIVPVYDMGHSDGQSYFAMEYVNGTDLQRAERPAPREAAELIRQIALAIHYAHTKGIVHRDLKPANILLDAHGTPRVTDFGLAKLTAQDDLLLTGKDQLMGTAPFMPPEQASGDSANVGPPADIYSLGAILYYLLTSQPPFIGKSTYDILRKVQSDEPYAPGRLADSVPRDLETICLKALEKAPERRYETAETLADDLQRFLDNEPISAARASVSRRLVRQAKRHRWITVAVVACLALAAWRTWDYIQYSRPTSGYFTNVVLRGGAPEGIGALRRVTRLGRATTYRVVRSGRLGPITSVIAENSAGHPVDSDELPTFLDAQFGDLSEDMPSVSRLDFQWKTADEDAELVVDQVIALDAGGRRQWSFTFSEWPSRGRYYGPDGYQRARTGSGASHVEFAYNTTGRLREVLFYDGLQRPMPNSVGAFGYQIDYDDDDRTTVLTCLGPNGNPTVIFGVTKFRRQYDDNGKLVALHCLDEDDNRTLCLGGFTSQTYKYDSFGNLIEYAHWGPTGQPITGFDGEASARFTYDESGFLIEDAYFGVAGRPIAATAERFAVRRFTNDERGRAIVEAFFDGDGNPTENASGYASVHRQYNASGLITEEKMFGIDGEPSTDAYGVWHTTYSYDELGNNLETAQFDEQGDPASNTLSWSRRVYSYERDNLVLEEYFDAEGEPTFVEEGYTSVTYEYADVRANMSAITYRGPDGRPILVEGGYTQVQYKYDALDNVTSESYFDENGRRTLTDAGWHRAVNHYDKHGNLVRLDLQDTSLNPTLHTDGNASEEYVLDDRGNVIEIRYFDALGELTMVSSGYAIVRSAYDNRGNETETAYFDCEEKPVRVPGFSAAKIVRKFDAQSNVIVETTFDAFGRPTENSEGVATTETDYDELGNAVEKRFFDAYGVPARGVARISNDLDARGRVITERSLNSNAEPVVNASGFAVRRMSYDRLDRVTEESVFGPDDQATTSVDGVWRTAYTFDKLGNEIEQALFDAQNQPTTSKEGWSRRTSQYHQNLLTAQYFFDAEGRPAVLENGSSGFLQEHNERGHVNRIVHLGQDGKPTTISSGCAIEQREVDGGGYVIRESYFDVDGKPTRTNAGWHASTNFYDERYRWVGYDFLDKDLQRTFSSEGYSAQKMQLDERGNAIETIYLGLDDEPIDIPAGYAQITRIFDDRDNEIETRYFDASGEPIFVASEEAATIRREFDSAGNTIKESRYDVKMRPLENSLGVAVTEFGYNERGQLVERSYYDAFGAPTSGIARHVMKCDARGNAIEESYYDANGKLTLSDDGYAKIVNVYDRLGRRTEFKLYDDEGNRTAHRQGHSRIVKQFDSHGNVIKEWLYDEHDNLLVGEEEYAILAIEYDQFGNRTGERYFNPDGSPAIYYEGYHRYAARYERGLLVEYTYYDVDGSITLSRDGYARKVYHHDDLLRGIGGAYFGTSGEPVEVNGVHRWELELDERDSVTEYRYFGAGDQPSLRADDGDAEFGFGFAKMQIERDRYGNETESTVFGVDGQPVLRQPHGYWKSLITYDERGNALHTSYFDTLDNPVVTTLGFAEIAFEYDVHGNRIGRRYYDAEGELIPIEVRVTDVSESAAAAGFQHGDILVRLNRQPITDTLSLDDQLKRSLTRDNQLQIVRDGEQLTLSLPSADAIAYRDAKADTATTE